MGRAVLVDGDDVLARAFFAIPAELRTASGQHTNALYGLVLALRRAVGTRHPEFGAMALTAKGATAPGGRPAAGTRLPAAFDTQRPLRQRVAEAHGFTVVKQPGRRLQHRQRCARSPGR